MKEITQMSLPSSLTDIPDREGNRAKNTIGKDDFMKLLMVQLQNQDPLKPMDHQEFSAQLAQFSSLEQLNNIGKGIEKLHGGMGEEQKFQALNMIGRQVAAQGNEVNLVEGSPVSLNYSLAPNVTAQKAMIYDSGGNVVRELSVDGREAESSLVWDGRSQDGVKLPSGRYKFRVAGVDQNGVPQEAGSELSGTVTGVELEGKNAMLIVRTASGQTKLEMSKVRQVALPDNQKDNQRDNQTAAPALRESRGPQVIPVQKPSMADLMKAVNAADGDEDGPSAEEADEAPSTTEVAQAADADDPFEDSNHGFPTGGWGTQRATEIFRR